MRSVPCPAPLLLVLLALPSAAQEVSPVRLLPRTVFWSSRSGPVELQVVPGSATFLRLEGFPSTQSPQLAEGPSTVRLLPSEADAFLVTVSRDFAAGERARVTVKLGPPPALEVPLLLVSRKDRGDGEVRLVRLQAPTLESLGVEGLARASRPRPRDTCASKSRGPSTRARRSASMWSPSFAWTRRCLSP